mgnify:FL=1
MMTAEMLRAFEDTIAADFEAANIRAPVHLSGGNETQLIEIFQDIAPEDWVFSTYRNHFHALLHGLPADWVRAQIHAGRSMFLSSPQHCFLSSAIVGGMLPIAVGVAAALQRLGETCHVWVFVGDMAATTGAFHEAVQYADGQDLPVHFVVEDNGFSTDSPTLECWGKVPVSLSPRVRRYTYARMWPHSNIGKWVNF